MKKAIVTGITGQDGAYLVKFLIENDYMVYGCFRRLSTPNFWRLNDLGIDKNSNLVLVDMDLTDFTSILTLIQKVRPDEIYNLAAQSFVKVSFDQPALTTEINSLGVLYILESIRIIDRNIKFYQASTSEMFGMVQETPQSETTPFYPRSPYAISKLYSHWLTINYSESYNIFASSGILFNHESPLRGIEFVTRKISDSVAKIKCGLIDSFKLGNLEAKRDWGHAKDYVEGMYKILAYKQPDVFVLATGKTFSVRDFLEMTLKNAQIDFSKSGTGLDESYIDNSSNKIIVSIDKEFYRPAEVDFLLGDSSKARDLLGWKPSTSLEDLCSDMYKEDLLRNQKFIK